MAVVLSKHSAAAAVIGKILLDYTQLEFAFCQCVGSALNDQEAAIRCMFRLRGGDVRIQVGDAICRPRYDGIGMKDAYDAGLGALRYATKIRNQYAHAQWVDWDENNLCFVDLEKVARTAVGSMLVNLNRVDLQLLQTQEKYMEYSSDWLWHLHSMFEQKANRSPNYVFPPPKIIEQPNLHNPPSPQPPSAAAGAASDPGSSPEKAR